MKLVLPKGSLSLHVILVPLYMVTKFCLSKKNSSIPTLVNNCPSSQMALAPKGLCSIVMHIWNSFITVLMTDRAHLNPLDFGLGSRPYITLGCSMKARRYFLTNISTSLQCTRLVASNNCFSTLMISVSPSC